MDIKKGNISSKVRKTVVPGIVFQVKMRYANAYLRVHLRLVKKVNVPLKSGELYLIHLVPAVLFMIV